MMIRIATPDDVEEIGRMWEELIAYHRKLDPMMPAPAKDGARRYSQRMRYGLDDSYFQLYVAEQDEMLVGYVFGTIIDLLPEMFESERAGMIGDIYVRFSYRHQGIGKHLMRAMKDWFLQRGVAHYEWYVASANEEAIRFWKGAMNGRSVMVRMRASLNEE